MATICCERMAQDLNQVCDQHESRFDCGDALIHAASDGAFGIIVHDGAGMFVEIGFCPWCGTKLPGEDNGDRRMDLG
ncbi:MAG TPA: hypothetical protein VHL34_00030 [Rhizomicrobium sp.]|nr:hypothetical protein [Rhizomicrobium sp.]